MPTDNPTIIPENLCVQRRHCATGCDRNNIDEPLVRKFVSVNRSETLLREIVYTQRDC